jgi:phosphoribosylaminoimidazole-succinocarboxamide synthase
MTVTTDRLAEGKTKILRPGAAPEEILVEFKNDATAFNGKKHAEIPGKGELNAKISTLLFQLLAEHGIPSCFVRSGSKSTELVYKRLTMIPLEVVVRNFAYGSVVKRFKFEEGMPFNKPLVEFFHKTDDDPQITEDLILELNLVPTESVLDAIKRIALQVNEVFLAYFSARGIRCADFKLEFGFDPQGNLLLGDELSPDNFRLRDIQTGAVLDKDVFRLDLADLGDTYRTLLARLEQPVATPAQDGRKQTYTGEVFVHSRKNILNPESKAILEGLQVLGHANVKTLSAGKRFMIKLEADSMVAAEQELRRIAGDVLSNPVIEDYELRIKP